MSDRNLILVAKTQFLVGLIVYNNTSHISYNLLNANSTFKAYSIHVLLFLSHSRYASTYKIYVYSP